MRRIITTQGGVGGGCNPSHSNNGVFPPSKMVQKIVQSIFYPMPPLPPVLAKRSDHCGEFAGLFVLFNVPISFSHIKLTENFGIPEFGEHIIKYH